MSKTGHKEPLFDNDSSRSGSVLTFGQEFHPEEILDIAEPTLLELLGKLAIRPELGLNHPRNVFVDEKDFIPGSLREVTISVIGPWESINRGGHAKINRGQPIERRHRPVEETYNEIRGFFDEAGTNKRKLNAALPPSSDDLNSPALELIWTSQEIRDKLVEFIMRRMSLDAYDWRMPKTIRVSAEEQWSSRIRRAAGPALVGAWRLARDNEKNRHENWGRVLNQLGTHPRVVKAASRPDSKIRLL